MDTAERLIASTRELLWERGYGATSPKAIQERAQAGQGSMYHHFSGKPALALAAIRRSSEELMEKVDEEITIPGTAYERIRAYLLRERDVLRGCPIGRLAQDAEIVGNDDLRAPLAETFDWLRIRMSALVAEGQETGEFAATLDPDAVAATLVSVLQGAYVQARAAGSTEVFDQSVSGILALLSPEGN